MQLFLSQVGDGKWLLGLEENALVPASSTFIVEVILQRRKPRPAIFCVFGTLFDSSPNEEVDTRQIFVM